jgi:glycosyltransferase involved in cell wall biosynthesis
MAQGMTSIAPGFEEKMDHKPLVSVITPFYNTSPEFLEEAIRSVFAQTYENWELLLIDDGSAGPSADLARSYAANHPERVYYFDHAGHENKGHPASRNLGIRNSKGKYIAFLDADDICMPRKLEEQEAILESRPEVGMVYSNTLYWFSWTGRPEDAHRDFLPKLGVDTDVIYPPLSLLPLFLSGAAAVPSMNSILIRSDAITRSGRFEESFRSLYGDQHFYAKLCLTEHIYVSGKVHDWYRQHPESMTSIADKSGTEVQARRIFLEWLERYMTRKAVTDVEVWQALRREIWRIHYPDWLPHNETLQNIIRPAKNWILKAEGGMLPESIRNRLWKEGPVRPGVHP